MNQTKNEILIRGYSQSFLNKTQQINSSNNTTHVSHLNINNKITSSSSSFKENENNETQKLYSKILKKTKDNQDRREVKENKEIENHKDTSFFQESNNLTSNLLNNSKIQKKVILSRYVNEEEWRKASENKRITLNNHQVIKKLSQAMKEGPISFDNGKLSLVGCYITEIDMIPEKISSIIKTLYLSHNSLTSLQNIQQFKYLTSVSLANNSIRYLHLLTPLSSLVLLEKISLEGNIVTHMPYYREIIIGLCSSSLNHSQNLLLESIDSIPITSEEKVQSRVNYRKCCVQIEQLRCNGLRVIILEHMYRLFSCHAEIISYVMGKFRSLLASHIDITTDSHGINSTLSSISSSSCVSTTLRYALSGGVYRWLQLSGGRDFEIQAQDMAYRLFLTSLKKLPSSQKTSLFEKPSILSLHWDKIMGEAAQHYQRVCLSLIENCERSYEKILIASQRNNNNINNFSRNSGSNSNHNRNDLFRRSHEYDIIASEMGMKKLTIEKENQPTFSHDGIQAINSLQQVQFLNCNVFQDPLTIAMNLKLPISNVFDVGSNNLQISEIQQYYCGIGPHSSNIVFKEDIIRSYSSNELRNKPTGHQQKRNNDDNSNSYIDQNNNRNQKLNRNRNQKFYGNNNHSNHSNNLNHNFENNDNIDNEYYELNDSKVRQKYIKLLKEGIHKRNSNQIKDNKNEKSNNQIKEIKKVDKIREGNSTHRKNTSNNYNLNENGNNQNNNQEYDANQNKVSFENNNISSSLSTTTPPTPTTNLPIIKIINKIPSQNEESPDSSSIQNRNQVKQQSNPNISNISLENCSWNDITQILLPSILSKLTTSSPTSPTSHSVTITNKQQQQQEQQQEQKIQEEQEEQEELIINILNSSQFTNFLDDHPTIDQTNSNVTPSFQVPSTEWSNSLFNNENLFSSEVIRNAIINSISSPSNSFPPQNIVGAPPLPLPLLPEISQTNMKSLSYLFDSIVKQLDDTYSSTFLLWNNRKNLQNLVDKIKEQIELEIQKAITNLKKLSNLQENENDKVKQLIEWINISDIAENMIKLKENQIQDDINELNLQRDQLSKSLDEFNLERIKKNDLLIALEEVVGAVSIMINEIKNSSELQQSLRSLHNKQVLNEHMNQSNKLLSLQRSIFQQFRRNIYIHQRVEELFHEKIIKNEIYLLLLCWKKLQKYVLVQKNIKKSIKWIQKSQLEKWLIKWKYVYKKSCKINNFIQTNQKNQLHKSILKWRMNLKYKKNKDKQLMKSFILLKNYQINKIFHLWKNYVENEIIKKSKNQNKSILFKTKNNSKLSPFTISLRLRDVEENNQLIIAKKHYLKRIFLNWKKVIKLQYQLIEDKEIVLSSIINRNLVRNCFNEWIIIYLSNTSQKNRSYKRLFKRWHRYILVKTYSLKLKKRAFISNKFQKMCKYLIRWKCYKNNRKRLKQLEIKLKSLLNLKIKLNCLYNWKRMYKIEIEEKFKESRAISFYFLNLMTKSWRKWFEWCISNKMKLERNKLQLIQSSQNKKYLDVKINNYENIDQINMNQNLLNQQYDSLSNVSDDDETVSTINNSDNDYDNNDYNDNDINNYINQRKEKLIQRKKYHSLIIIPHSKILLKKLSFAFLRWMKVARNKSRLSVAYSICMKQTRQSIQHRVFSYLIMLTTRNYSSRINDSKELMEGSETFNKRTISAHNENILLQEKLREIQLNLDENTSILAEKQSKVEILSSTLSQIEHEVKMYQEMIHTKLDEYNKQKEVIESILYLCKGDNSSIISSQSTSIISEDKKMDLLTEKISLLSLLEKYNEDAISSSIYLENEKYKFGESIQEGLSIGKKYKNILQVLQEEQSELESERVAAEVCLNECKVKLEHTMNRVKEKCDADDQNMNELESEKKIMEERYQNALNEEALLREELNQLRDEVQETELEIRMQEIQSQAPLSLYASENSAISNMNYSLSNQNLSKKQIDKSNSLLNYLESPPNKITSFSNELTAPILSSAATQQRKSLNYEENRKLFDQFSLALSPPSITSVVSPKSTSFHSNDTLSNFTSFDNSSSTFNSNSVDGIDSQIQSLSKRIRERLKSPPQI